MIFFMGGALAGLKSAIGANVAKAEHVGGRLGFHVDKNIPNWEKNELQRLGKLPQRTSDREVVTATEKASELEAQSQLLAKLHKQWLRQAKAHVAIREVRVEHTKEMLGLATQVGFNDASFLKFLMGNNLNEQVAAAEVRGCDRAHNRSSGIFGG
jgi:hypothetical protein